MSSKVHSCIQDLLSAHLGGVGFNGRAALRSAVQGKVNEGLRIRESHLVDDMAHDIGCNTSRLTEKLWSSSCFAGRLQTTCAHL